MRPGGPPGTICKPPVGDAERRRAAPSRRPWRRRRRRPRRRPMPASDARALARPRRMPAAAMRWPFSAGVRERSARPRTARRSPSPRAALRSAAATRPGSRLGRMSERSAAIGLASASAGAPPPNSFGLLLGDEGPGHRLDAGRGAASARRASRARFCISVSTGLARRPSSARQRRRGHAVDAGMRRISSTMSALPWMSGRQDGGDDWRDVARLRRREAERAQGSPSPRRAERRAPAAACVSLQGKSMRARARRRIARRRPFATARRRRFEHELRREIEPRHAEVGIDAALEAIARVGHDPELAAGVGDVHRVPQRAFDQHVARRLVAAGMLAAHDAGDAIRRRASSAITTMLSSSA